MTEEKNAPEVEEKMGVEPSGNAEEKKSEETKDLKEKVEPSQKEETQQTEETDKKQDETDWKKRYGDSTTENQRIMAENENLAKEKERLARVVEIVDKNPELYNKVLSIGLGKEEQPTQEGDEPAPPTTPSEELTPEQKEIRANWKNDIDTFLLEHPGFEPDQKFYEDFGVLVKSKDRTFSQSLKDAFRIHPSSIQQIKEEGRVEGIAEAESASNASSESVPSSVSGSPSQENLTAEEARVAEKMGLKPDEVAEYKNDPNKK